ncbi:L-2-amino-thiazoline-4-carboxylic acid hydrolase [Phreatobacter cathodiphilus]|uniref:2-amino-thiazoline-4-carboxylic acid hydrolase n=1 Tax=Phreatobacter cathodiphilus TaxID=1868589 RepID=A0A2S0NDU3_9HYPH|nr:L-2-amino-thiazoline-4-carboxylic acid hydrolase [Phreatobacter cathodiphilus]AVO46325.1 2-amino-thiazoline-4-carboxylic acid hydrolase [Phreatobacter cathodiphilus]
MTAASTAPAHPAGLSMIEKRRIEAEILKHVYEQLKESHGVEVARSTIGEAVRRSALEQAARFAAQSPEGPSLQGFIDMQPLWTAEGALTVEEIGRTETTYAFNVVRCRYSEMYKAMGLGEIGALLSCQRDGTFCEGYDPKLKLERTQTIMQGASHCDFRFTYEADTSAA